MAVAVDQGFSGHGAERQLEAAGGGFANEKFLEQKRVRADGLCGVVAAKREQLVAQRQETARLKAYDRHATLRERRVSLNQPVKLGAGVIDEAGGEKRPSAA